MLKLLLFINFLSFNDTTRKQQCIDVILEKIFEQKTPNYFMFIPIERPDGSSARLMILKSNLKKYMETLDSSFKDNDTIKKFFKRVYSGKKKFEFSQFFYNETFGADEYQIVTKKNKFLKYANGKEREFLNKYLSNFNDKSSYFEYSVNVPIEDDVFGYEFLFDLGFIVYNGHDRVMVNKVCYYPQPKRSFYVKKTKKQ